MKYVALLRGVNVGGNSIIKMADLKETVEKSGFTNVKTFINSGNVIFESGEKNSVKIATVLEAALKKRFNLESRVILRTYEQFKQILSEVPADWKKQKDIRCYIAFIREPLTAQDVIKQIQLKEGVDFVQAGKGVVYMTTLMSGLTKSGFTRLIAKPVYKGITMRNYTTAKKLLTLMDG
jgi:uncharacterized protein (DUF1697 family)